MAAAQKPIHFSVVADLILFWSHVDLIRGVYLATVFYHKENIMVTAEDQIPLVEIQCCSTSIIHDFLWFAKVICQWIYSTHTDINDFGTLLIQLDHSQ